LLGWGKHDEAELVACLLGERVCGVVGETSLGLGAATLHAGGASPSVKARLVCSLAPTRWARAGCTQRRRPWLPRYLGTCCRGTAQAACGSTPATMPGATQRGVRSVVAGRPWPPSTDIDNAPPHDGAAPFPGTHLGPATGQT